MILSNILRKNLFQNKSLTTVKTNLKTLKELTIQLRHTKSKNIFKNVGIKQFNSINSKLNKKKIKLINQFSKESLLNYIINVNFSLTNTLINITDPNGNTIKSFSAGYVDLTKNQKKVQPLAIAKILNFLLIKCWFLKHKIVALHFRNVRLYYQTKIVKWLNDKIFVKSIQTFNFLPHNGCRPKKLRRFKRRTKRLVLY